MGSHQVNKEKKGNESGKRVYKTLVTACVSPFTTVWSRCSNFILSSLRLGTTQINLVFMYWSTQSSVIYVIIFTSLPQGGTQDIETFSVLQSHYGFTQPPKLVLMGLSHTHEYVRCKSNQRTCVEGNSRYCDTPFTATGLLRKRHCLYFLVPGRGFVYKLYTLLNTHSGFEYLYKDITNSFCRIKHLTYVPRQH